MVAATIAVTASIAVGFVMTLVFVLPVVTGALLFFFLLFMGFVLAVLIMTGCHILIFCFTALGKTPTQNPSSDDEELNTLLQRELWDSPWTNASKADSSTNIVGP